MKLIPAFLLFLLISCGQKAEDSKKNSSIQSSKKEKKLNHTRSSAKETKALHTDSEKIDAGEWQWSECVRGEPEAICKSKAFRKHSFRVDSTSTSTHIGYENVTLNNGDLLKITNAGCEYYVLEFQFTTSRFSKDTTDFTFWSEAVIDLLKSVDENVDAPFAMKDSYPFLKAYYQNNDSKLGVPQQFNDSEIANTISMNRIEKSGTKYQLTITYAVGPL